MTNLVFYGLLLVFLGLGFSGNSKNLEVLHANIEKKKTHMHNHFDEKRIQQHSPKHITLCLVELEYFDLVACSSN